jgi:predicted GNAT family N-acyltransferase
MIRIIEPSNQQEWDAYYQLRYETLRKPWNQPIGSEKDEMENESLHFFALEDDKPIGVCRLQYNDEKTAQIRFMGVDDKIRGKGIGSKLIAHAEARAKSDGRSEMILQARDYAVPFYEINGYAIRGKTFLLWDTIQHYLMEKKLF